MMLLVDIFYFLLLLIIATLWLSVLELNRKVAETLVGCKFIDCLVGMLALPL